MVGLFLAAEAERVGDRGAAGLEEIRDYRCCTNAGSDFLYWE